MLDIAHLTSASSAGGSFWQKHLDRQQQPLSNHMALMSTACSAVNTLRSGCAGWVSEDTRTVGPIILGNDDFLLVSRGGSLNEWQAQPQGVSSWQAQRKTSWGWRVVGMGDSLDNPLMGSDLLPLLLEFSDAPPVAYSTYLDPDGVPYSDPDSAYYIDPVGYTETDVQPVFLLLVPAQYTVLTLVGKNKLLHAGIHFESRPGVLIFRDHPQRWLAFGPTIVKLALDSGPLTSDYVLSSEVLANKDVTLFYRQQATPGMLLAASCAAAGLVQVKTTGVVAAIADKPGTGRVYTLEAGERIDVPYNHTPISEGSAVTAGEYIGASPLICNDLGNWWSDAPWGLGIDLSEITPWKLFAPNKLVSVSCVDSAIQIQLQGDATELTRWWDFCAANDPDGSLAYELDLLDGDTALFNPLWMFSQYAWSTTALVVNLNAQGLEDKMRTRMSSFLKRERPLGKILLVLDPQQQ